MLHLHHGLVVYVPEILDPAVFDLEAFALELSDLGECPICEPDHSDKASEFAVLSPLTVDESSELLRRALVRDSFTVPCPTDHFFKTIDTLDGRGGVEITIPAFGTGANIHCLCFHTCAIVSLNDTATHTFPCVNSGRQV